MSCNRLFLFLVICIGVLPSIKAQESNPPINFFIGGALEMGGEAVATVSFADGSKQSIKAGQGGTIGVGIKWHPANSNKWSLKGMIGIKYVTTKATNANITLTRMPIRVTANYHFSKNIWSGVGITSHQLINFNAGGIGNNASFSSNMAPTFEFGFKEFSLMYTPMTYKDPSQKSYNAGAIGIGFAVDIKKKQRRERK